LPGLLGAYTAFINQFGATPTSIEAPTGAAAQALATYNSQVAAAQAAAAAAAGPGYAPPPPTGTTTTPAPSSVPGSDGTEAQWDAYFAANPTVSAPDTSGLSAAEWTGYYEANPTTPVTDFGQSPFEAQYTAQAPVYQEESSVYDPGSWNQMVADELQGDLLGIPSDVSSFNAWDLANITDPSDAAATQAQANLAAAQAAQAAAAAKAASSNNNTVNVGGTTIDAATGLPVGTPAPSGQTGDVLNNSGVSVPAGSLTIGPSGTTSTGTAASPYGATLPQATLDQYGPSALATEVAAGAATQAQADEAEAVQAASDLSMAQLEQATDYRQVINTLGGSGQEGPGIGSAPGINLLAPGAGDSSATLFGTGNTPGYLDAQYQREAAAAGTGVFAGLATSGVSPPDGGYNDNPDYAAYLATDFNNDSAFGGDPTFVPPGPAPTSPDESASVDTGQGFATDASPPDDITWPYQAAASVFNNYVSPIIASTYGGTPGGDTGNVGPTDPVTGMTASGDAPIPTQAPAAWGSVGNAIYGSVAGVANAFNDIYAGVPYGSPEVPKSYDPMTGAPYEPDIPYQSDPELTAPASPSFPDYGTIEQPDVSGAAPATSQGIPTWAIETGLPQYNPNNDAYSQFGTPGEGFPDVAGPAPDIAPAADDHPVPPADIPDIAETWTFPQSKAEKYIETIGRTNPTLRQIAQAFGEQAQIDANVGWLGEAGVSTPLDLTQPWEPQLSAAIGGSGFVANQAISKMQGGLTGKGITDAAVIAAATAANNPTAWGPGGGPGLGDVYEDIAEDADPASFEPIQVAQQPQAPPPQWDVSAAAPPQAPDPIWNTVAVPPVPNFPLAQDYDVGSGYGGGPPPAPAPYDVASGFGGGSPGEIPTFDANQSLEFSGFTPNPLPSTPPPAGGGRLVFPQPRRISNKTRSKMRRRKSERRGQAQNVRPAQSLSLAATM